LDVQPFFGEGIGQEPELALMGRGQPFVVAGNGGRRYVHKA
jgi:hypothetical protein